ncbi:MAG: hypothetical protein OJF58_002234 [Enhydrobacter sp.]|nr:MAG: hypothetical protein OJF58_002234 [Enhydrobacter sp.]
MCHPERSEGSFATPIEGPSLRSGWHRFSSLVRSPPCPILS